MCDPTGLKVHFCTRQCSACGYFCERPFDHDEPLCTTTHGSMRNTTFVSTQEA